jgi:peptidoglycan hydrolase CwlO-like protein
MKTKLVLWGNDKEDKKILIALELLSVDNKVVLRVVPEGNATEELYSDLMEKWRDNQEVTFPEDTVVTTQPLTLTNTLLPEDIKVEKTDIINKAQAEWHFVVLSEKLYASYLSEIDGMKEKITTLSGFDKGAWEELKGLQSKIQTQYRDRNIQREHIGDLRNKVNELFDSMKLLRAAQDAEYRDLSNANFDKLTSKLGTIENQISEGVRFNIVFDALKSLQRDLKGAKLVREQRNELWERVDAAFKIVKERKFGPQTPEVGSNSALTRVNNRYNGLLSAIDRMNTSINRDKEELKDQLDKIKHSRFEGVLEQQISQAKVNMIENRITSKESKLREMNATRIELETKMANIKEKEEKRAKKEAERKAAEAAEKAAQSAKVAEENAQAEATQNVEVAAEEKTEAVEGVTETEEKSEESEK